ncbi:MAG: hypothetical protein IRZ31_07070 [Thermogemmatispora sp.]|uniref:hypothetical protein n=1 Tax=Thermogemmatispora sp. TaxID=1968838 RepID=UPI0026283CDC|nr:hypothetical protein [Thermogemmatispora sp.]MBX5456646.1 hypothetical protein [Thermogemmatispora sp.]
MSWFTNSSANGDDEAGSASEATPFPVFESAADLSDLGLVEPAEASYLPDDPPTWELSEIQSPPAREARPTRQLSSPLPDTEAGPPRLPSAPARHRLRLRRWLPVGTFLLGLLSGVLALWLVALLFISPDHPPLPSPSPAAGESDLVLQLSPAYLTALVARNLPRAGLPGQVSQVRVTLQPRALIEVTGQETLTLFGMALTRPFFLQVQPVIVTCHPQVHVLHADLGGLPVTGLAAIFEERLNQQLSQQPAPAGLPAGFRYCAVATWTTTNGLWISYSAQPTALRPSLLAERTPG